jgi:oligogalacturonide transport system substrate-binding protein
VSCLKKKGIKGFIALLSAVCVLTGCTGSVSDVEYKTTKSDISFSWWGDSNRNTYTMDGVDVFEQLNEDIEVKCKYANWNGYSKRQNIYMKSNEKPDVMQINYNWLSDYSKDGEGFYDIYELTDYVDLSNYTQTELSYGEINGHLNALPIAFNVETMYYNKDMYDKYGLDLPKTFDDFFVAARVMQQDGIYPMFMGEKAAFFFLISYFEQSTGKSVCDDDGNIVLTKDDIKFMLEFYKRLVDEGVIPVVGKYNLNYFMTGKTAGIMGWISDSAKYCSALVESGANVVVGDYPKLEGATKLGWYVKPATMYAISDTTEQPEAAARLLDFLLNSEDMAILQKTEKGIPISNSAYKVLEQDNMIDGLAGSANVLLEENQKEMSGMKAVLEDENIYMGFEDEAAYYLYGNKTIDNVAENIYNMFYGGE